MAEKIELGMLVKVGGITVHIITVDWEGRLHERDKHISPERPIFGTVEGIYRVQKEVLGENEEVVKPAKFEALVKWVGPKYRNSILPVEKLIPAINQTHPRRMG